MAFLAWGVSEVGKDPQNEQGGLAEEPAGAEIQPRSAGQVVPPGAGQSFLNYPEARLHVLPLSYAEASGPGR